MIRTNLHWKQLYNRNICMLLSNIEYNFYKLCIGKQTIKWAMMYRCYKENGLTSWSRKKLRNKHFYQWFSKLNFKE